MIATIFTPTGIVISTVGSDTFYQTGSGTEADLVERLDIAGLPHVVTFWDRYALVFHQTDCYRVDAGIPALLREVMNRWAGSEAVPTLPEFMPYIKKQLVDRSIQILGIMGGYCAGPDGATEQYVYQILGEDIRRINTDAAGVPAFNYAFLEINTGFGRMLREVKVKNGDEWEELPPARIRCDLFSVDKALEVTSFMLRTSVTFKNINTSAQSPSKIESVVITPDSLKIL